MLLLVVVVLLLLPVGAALGMHRLPGQMLQVGFHLPQLLLLLLLLMPL